MQGVESAPGPPDPAVSAEVAWEEAQLAQEALRLAQLQVQLLRDRVKSLEGAQKEASSVSTAIPNGSLHSPPSPVRFPP